MTSAALMSPLREARAGEDRQGGIAREARIGLRQLAHHEGRSLRAADDAPVRAAVAQAGRRPRVLPLWPHSRNSYHDGMFTSEALTRGIRVAVVAEYAPS